MGNQFREIIHLFHWNNALGHSQKLRFVVFQYVRSNMQEHFRRVRCHNLFSIILVIQQAFFTYEMVLDV